MTGTSLDGIDAALVEIIGESLDDLAWRLIRSQTVAYTDERRDLIHDAITAGSAASICSLHAEMGEWLATAVVDVCGAEGLDYV